MVFWAQEGFLGLFLFRGRESMGRKNPNCSYDYDLYAYLGRPEWVLQVVDACELGLDTDILIDEAEKVLLPLHKSDTDWYKPWLDGDQALFIFIATNTGVGWIAIGPGPRSAYRYEDAGVSDKAQAITVFHALTELRHKPISPTYLADIFLSHIDQDHNGARL